jgi:methylthioribose-1-phosphate isomerase
MKIHGENLTTIWEGADGASVEVLDQRVLPHLVESVTLRSVSDAHRAIVDMTVRGAPLIGVAAAYGLWLASLCWPARDFRPGLVRDAEYLKGSRPTAVNLAWAIDTLVAEVGALPEGADVPSALLAGARRIRERELAHCRAIGEHGVRLLEEAHRRAPGRPVRLLTHCNAGWLACIDWGTATAPIYVAQERGIPVEVWVDETRPRNQGASLTAFELGQQGIEHHVIVDNVGGHLMQHGLVDLCITGADRVTRRGDAANKIGTYLKALAAKDNHVPFYVALPSSTLDLTLGDGVAEIPIEERGPEEVTHITGWDGSTLRTVRVTPEGSPAVNYGFDVTPARLITGLITERGLCAAEEAAILRMLRGAPGAP